MSKKHKKKAKQMSDQIGKDNRNETSLPDELLNDYADKGIFLGVPRQVRWAVYIGIRQGEDGNVLVIGYAGSGKTTSIAIPTLATWGDSAYIIDVKGELERVYRQLYKLGIVTRQCIVFAPMRDDTVCYDPYRWLDEDGEENLLSNLTDLAQTLVPTVPGDLEPFWVQGEQQVLAALLHAGYTRGLSFSETITWILNSDLAGLCAKLRAEGDATERMLLGKIEDNSKMLASIERGLRNHLAVFIDPRVAHALRGSREGANVFTWRDLEEHNIFLNIPADKVEIWAPAIRLITAQLLRYLERRPDQYTEEGKRVTRMLLLLDEFARLGKLPMMADTVSTLRSKQVNFMVFCQSIAQIDKIYGKYDREIIADNCSHLVGLGANDPATQRYLADRVGTRLRKQYSLSKQMDHRFHTTGYTWQTGECREYLVQPHEFSAQDDAVLVSPYGVCRMDKLGPDNDLAEKLLSTREDAGEHPLWASIIRPNDPELADRKNTGAKILTPEERLENANRRISGYEDRRARERERRCREREIDKFVGMVLGDSASVAEMAPQERRNAVLHDLANDPAAVKWLRDRVKHGKPQRGVFVPMKSDVEVDTHQKEDDEDGNAST